MKPLLCLALILSTAIVRAGETTPPAAPAGPPGLLWEMELAHLETRSNGGLRLAAILSHAGETAVLEIEIPPGSVKKRENVRGRAGVATYRFPVYLRASDTDAAFFKRLIASDFGANPPASFVRHAEYSATALRPPGKLGRNGGTIFLVDPTGHPFNWSIVIEIDPAGRRLTLQAAETHYR